METDWRVGDSPAETRGERVEYQGQLHAITAFDFIFRQVTLRPVDEEKPLGQRFAPAVVIPLSKLSLK